MSDMLTGRALHLFIRDRITEALGHRTYTCLAEKSGVPHSTLSGQLCKPKLSLDVLVRVASALERHPADFLPLGSARVSREPPQKVAAILGDLADIIRTYESSFRDIGA